jgi:hypothetical protein
MPREQSYKPAASCKDCLLWKKSVSSASRMLSPVYLDVVAGTYGSQLK